MSKNHAINVALHVVPGFLLGGIVDLIVYKIKVNNDLNVLTLIVIQTIIIILILYWIEKYFPKYALEWQDTTPGILFTFCFFAPQFHYFDNIKEFIQSFED